MLKPILHCSVVISIKSYKNGWKMSQRPLGPNILLGPGPWESPGFSQPLKGIRQTRAPSRLGQYKVKWSLEAQPTNSEHLLTQKWQGTSPLAGFQSVLSQPRSEGSLQLMGCMFQSRLRWMMAGRSSPSSPCCRVSGTSNYKMRLSFDRKTGGGEGGGGRKRSEAGRGLFLGPVMCTPKGSAMLLHCPPPTKVVWKERCILFPNREAFQNAPTKTQSLRKTLLETFPESFALISVSVGEAMPLKTHTWPGTDYTYFQASSFPKQRVGPRLYKQGESDIKDTKI